MSSSTTSQTVLRCVAARVMPGPAGRGPAATGRSSPLEGTGSEDRSTAAYRSAARRLRGRFAGDPVRLQYSLLSLARREDARREEAGRRTHPTVRALHGMVDGEVAERFARLVPQHLDGPVLGYEDRQSLLEAARRLGI